MVRSTVVSHPPSPTLPITSARPSPASPASPAASAASAVLTILPTGNPRRLAFVLIPEPGEAFASWVDRLSADLHIPPGLAALHLGVEVRDRSGDVRPMFYGVALTPASRTRLLAATGLDEAVVDDMQLTRYDGTALDLTGLDLTTEASVRTWVKREWLLLHGSRACPRCLADSTAWPAWWRLGIAAVCPDHRVLLIDTCPSCGIGLRRGYSHHPRGLSRVVTTDPAVCGNHTRTGRCPQPLATIPITTVAEHLVAAQTTALRAADGHPITIAGTTVTPAEWFLAVKVLAAMIRFSGTTVPLLPGRTDTRAQAWMDDFAAEYPRRRRGGKIVPGSLRAIPETPRHAAGLLAATHTVLAAPSRRACSTALASLVAATHRARRRAGGHNPMRTMDVPEPLAGVLAELTPPASRVAGAIPTSSVVDVEVRHVPQLLDAQDYRDLIADHLPGTAEPTGRRLGALAAARVLGATSWAEAGQRLGMNARKTARASDVVVRRIRDVPAFWAAITEAVRRLGEREPVDYADRRRRLADLVEVPAAVLRPSCARLGFPVTPARCRHAAAWIWQHLTGGDVRDAPAYQQGWNASAESVRETARRFARWLPDPVATDLLTWAESLLERP